VLPNGGEQLGVERLDPVGILARLSTAARGSAFRSVPPNPFAKMPRRFS
jgi:hypothetical protein